jgi:hypothetical protein
MELILGENGSEPILAMKDFSKIREEKNFTERDQLCPVFKAD